MYNRVIQNLCTIPNDHHNKSSYYRSPYKIVTMLLTVFPVLYLTSIPENSIMDSLCLSAPQINNECNTPCPFPQLTFHSFTNTVDLAVELDLPFFKKPAGPINVFN